jgi:preprotein translocase subunit SecY
MWEKFRVIFTIPELRKKILLTLLLLGIYRVGYQIPLPLMDPAKMTQFSGGIADFINQMATFSASQLDQVTIFGLGIMPYISASIIFQLLGSVYPPLEKLQKEGESGRKKINEYTRYTTVLLCIIQSWMYLGGFASQFIYPNYMVGADATHMGHLPFFGQLTLVMIMTSGTVFLMWLGEQIDEYGIGNGISLLIMAGILARMPKAFLEIFVQLKKSGFGLGAGKGEIGVETVAVLIILFVAVIAGVIFMTQGQRRIPTQTAKHVRGRRSFGGQRQYLPLRINQAGVMPIIFASSLLLFPSVLLKWLSTLSAFWIPYEQAFHRDNSFTYNILYIALIYFFCYFWTAITFNPKDMADNLKNYGTFIPGYRPGRRTADYLEKVMIRITYVGAGFLSVVAIVPTLITSWLPAVDRNLTSFYGGTSLLIAVSVAFDLVQKIDSHLVMRNYKGLLEK